MHFYSMIYVIYMLNILERILTHLSPSIKAKKTSSLLSGRTTMKVLSLNNKVG